MMRRRLARSFPARLSAAVFAVGVGLVALSGALAYRAAERSLRERLLA